METCGTCGANWTEGQYRSDCPECGGGALEIACPRCGGRCGAKWRRTILDSHDSRSGHWIGACKLSFELAKSLEA